MPVDYVVKIRQYDYPKLLQLWERVRRGDPIPGWSKGKMLEHMVLRAFELEQADVIWPYEVRYENRVVEQIDGAVYFEALACLVEAKDYEDDVDIEPIAKLRNQLSRRPASAIGLVFSRSGFTEPAKILTRYVIPQTVLLWEGSEITLAVEQRKMCAGLKLKFRYAVEYGLPDYNLQSGGL